MTPAEVRAVKYPLDLDVMHRTGFDKGLEYVAKRMEQEAAEDALPIDEAWLESVGFEVNQCDQDEADPAVAYWAMPADSDFDLTVWGDGTVSLYGEESVPCKTRGDVLRLLRALGIELKLTPAPKP